MSRLVYAAGLIALFAGKSVLACVPIATVPYTISNPGKYCVTGNLVMATSGPGISIAADNVAIDFGGYEMSGVGITGGNNHGIYLVNRNNVGIRNGSLRGFDAGVYAVTGLNVVVEDMSIGAVGTGISTVNGSHYGFRRNHIFDALYRGISLSQGLPVLFNAQDQVASVSDNEINAVGGVSQTSSTVVYGIYAQHNAAIVSNNRIAGVRGATGSAGIYLARGSVAVENSVLAVAIGITCEPNAPSEKAVRNVAGFGSSNYTNCLQSDNF